MEPLLTDCHRTVQTKDLPISDGKLTAHDEVLHYTTLTCWNPCTDAAPATCVPARQGGETGDATRKVNRAGGIKGGLAIGSEVKGVGCGVM